ncbi:Oxysterol-binding protein-domain-containing protein [Scheffersomyces coipomensis]|uniref:Oxysterol-binding protein-domain-containing protein n=1 Tax=Scheffersomyces coipomensis TaxID=1788519 RepID=UPI00315D1A7E
MSTSQLNASLLKLKLLDALRSGDTSKVDGVITELSSTESTIQNSDIIQLKETVMHYAVQLSSLSLIQHLVTNATKYHIDINSQDADGNTPLHLAAMSSRLEVVKFLLSLPDINDTIVNLKKKQPVEVCKDLNIAQLMQFERAKFVEKVSVQLRQYFSDRDFTNLEKLLVQNPRAAELLDINGAEPTTGNTVLHEFIRKDDLQMCDWILKHGGDPFKRDKRGKLPIDLIHNKNDPLRKLLKVASKDQNIMDPVANTSNAIKQGAAPTYKGYLRKWTNFASGYKLRYFILDQFGILSYYTNQDDTNNSCRGSLNLGYAVLHLDSSEKLKFEIIGKNGIRWHLKANHPIETNRWVWTLQNAITIAKDNIKKKAGGVDVIDEESERGKSFEEHPEPRRSSSRLRIPSKKSKHKRTSSQLSLNSAAGSVADEDISSSIQTSRSVNTTLKSPNPNAFASESPTSPTSKRVLSGLNHETAMARLSTEDQFSIQDSVDVENFDYDLDEADEEYDSENESKTSDNIIGPLAEQVSTIKRSVDVEITSLIDLFGHIIESNVHAPDSREAQSYTLGLSTLKSIKEQFLKLNLIIQSRDEKLLAKLERQLEVNKLWESSIKQLENEIHQREVKLAQFEGQKKQLKKYLSVSGPSKHSDVSTPIDAGLIALHNEENLVPDDVLDEILNDDSGDEFFDADEFEEPEEEDKEVHEPVAEEEEIAPEGEEEKEETEKEAGEAVEEVPVDGTAAVPVTEEKAPPTYEKALSQYNKAQGMVLQKLSQEGSFLGYENPPRQKLSMDEDNRPKVGLWGILKSMIGKDMTRMTLPVSFNEPTSLLQRLAEDIEYSNLLNIGASYDDSTLRLIYVATFAATEYASTIDRIAKPFNPLLRETFEYCRPDEQYRLIVEQVSHHPPISACSAESPKWDYYGENAVDSKFRGRSFDFKHLGKMFCVLRPDNGVIDKNNNKVHEELYSWKKVNTSVVGIIIGNPTVDNFGKMEVTNHTTGDSIIVDLKQRGWRASSAYQLSGHAIDRHGKPQWAMGGHWNSKIFAKKIIDSPIPLGERRDSLVDPDASVPKIGSSNDPFSGSKFLVWQAAPRPKVPFNLTSFAITLNGIDDNLRSWLAPTDTRLRPDQRDMEDGKYDQAADEKHRVEVKQREARKKREENKETYVPNWFVKKVHPVTGDSFWEFKGEYWKLRKEHKLAGTGDIF